MIRCQRNKFIHLFFDFMCLPLSTQAAVKASNTAAHRSFSSLDKLLRFALKHLNNQIQSTDTQVLNSEFTFDQLDVYKRITYREIYGCSVIIFNPPLVRNRVRSFAKIFKVYKKLPQDKIS